MQAPAKSRGFLVNLYEMMKPKIVIERQREQMMRVPYYIFLDGKKIGVVPDGRTIVFDVEPGEHSLSLKADWLVSTSAKTFRVNENEVKTFTVSLFRFAQFLVPLVMAVALLGVVLRFAFEAQWFGLLALPIFIGLFLYFKFNRYTFLQLKTR
jgi:hypothetical protein